MRHKELSEQIDKKKTYTPQEISDIIQIDTPTIRTWRDLGVFSVDKREVYRLKTQEDKNLISGKDLLSFLEIIKAGKRVI